MICTYIRCTMYVHDRSVPCTGTPMYAKSHPSADAREGHELPPSLRDRFRESTRPIRALNRGLEVLAELNRVERAAINALASAVELPRTTTYRILETLRS